MADMLTELDRSLRRSMPARGGSVHSTPVRPSEQSPACQESPSRASSLAPMACATECGMCHEIRVPAAWCPDSIDGDYAVCAECNALDPEVPATTPRRGIVVTVALSEPAHLPQLNWAATLASIIRLATQDTSVIVIDTWEVSK